VRVVVSAVGAVVGAPAQRSCKRAVLEAALRQQGACMLSRNTCNVPRGAADASAAGESVVLLCRQLPDRAVQSQEAASTSGELKTDSCRSGVTCCRS
jgi:hypothetical protein